MYTDPESGVTFPFFQSQVRDEFGEPQARKGIGRIDLAEFEKDFLHVKLWNHISWFGFEGNRVLAGPFKAALRALVAKGLQKELRTFDGCFNIRPPKAGGMRYSMHAYGLAVDLNAAQNGYGARPKFSPEFVSCFAANGFEWGGLWSPPGIDGMHFQLVWVKVRTGPLAPTAWAGGGGLPLPPVYRLTRPMQRGGGVFRLQCKLRDFGYLPDKADGVFGPKTEAAVKLAQRGAGLAETGVADDAFIKSLGVKL